MKNCWQHVDLLLIDVQHSFKRQFFKVETVTFVEISAHCFGIVVDNNLKQSETMLKKQCFGYRQPFFGGDASACEWLKQRTNRTQHCCRCGKVHIS
jgi:hypothetical protein